MKYLEKTILCDTNTVIYIKFLQISKKKKKKEKEQLRLQTQKKFMYSVGKIFKLWGEKALVGIAIF